MRLIYETKVGLRQIVCEQLMQRSKDVFDKNVSVDTTLPTLKQTLPSQNILSTKHIQVFN